MDDGCALPIDAEAPLPAARPGGLAAAIVERLQPAASSVKVAEVRIGLGYTAVLLEDQRFGLAYTFRDLAQGGCAVFHGALPLRGRPVAELLGLLESRDAIEAGVGLACANALVNQDQESYLTGDVLEHLAVRPDDRVGMVGYFGPLVEALQRQARTLTVFERIAEPTGVLRPEAEAFAVLPECEVAIITSTTIITHAVDRLLEAAAGCREIVLLGPSTPLITDLLAARGVTLASGVVATNPAGVLEVISEGGGTRQYRSHVRKVAIRTRGHARAREATG
jgi:uncharacterized protein (DUF4213/DUF364 family)